MPSFPKDAVEIFQSYNPGLYNEKIKLPNWHPKGYEKKWSKKRQKHEIVWIAYRTLPDDDNETPKAYKKGKNGEMFY